MERVFLPKRPCYNLTYSLEGYRDVSKGYHSLIRGRSLFLYSLSQYVSCRVFSPPSPLSSMFGLAVWLHSFYKGHCPLCLYLQYPVPCLLTFVLPFLLIISSVLAFCFSSLCYCVFSYPVDKWPGRSNGQSIKAGPKRRFSGEDLLWLHPGLNPEVSMITCIHAVWQDVFSLKAE